jgi:Carboxypeptidase regulatory-like domain
MKSLFSWLTVFAVLPTTFVSAQAPRYSLAGKVVNARTGEPVKRALVHVRGQVSTTIDSGEAGETPFATNTFTDSGGAFRLAGLASGHYTVDAQKPEFTFVPEKESNEVELTGSIDGLTLHLSPLGVVTGKVTDRQRQPVRGANVVVLKSTIQDGLRLTTVVSGIVTDDQGIYRLWSLRPGKYFVQATGLTGGTNLYAGDTSPLHLSQEGFAPVYSGGETSLGPAHAIEIEAGTEARADISVNMERAYKIRGSLTNFVPRRTVAFELRSGAEEVFPSRVNVNGDTGKFEIQDVVPGTYVLRATQADLTAEIPVEVQSSDLDGLRLSLMAPVEITVNTRFTNSEDTSNDGIEILAKGSFCSAQFWPAGQRGKMPIETRPGLDGATIQHLAPGQYRVFIGCFAAFAFSALAGSQDLLQNPVLTVPAGLPTAIEITAEHGGSNIEGKLHVEGSVKRGPPTILLVPRFSGSTGPQTKMAFAPHEDKREYQFIFPSVAPGDYSIYAFSEGSDIEFRNPQYLQLLPAGASVRAERDRPISVELKGLIQ